MNFLSDFGVNPILLVAQVVNFLILLFILKKFLYGPILKVLAVRRQKIEESLKNAEEIELRLQKTNEDVEKILANAMDEAQKIIKESKEVGMQFIEAGKKTQEDIINKAFEQALEVRKTEYVRLEKQLKEHAGDLIALAFEKVTGKKITRDDQKKIIEKEVRNLS